MPEKWRVRTQDAERLQVKDQSGDISRVDYEHQTVVTHVVPPVQSSFDLPQMELPTFDESTEEVHQAGQNCVESATLDLKTIVEYEQAMLLITSLFRRCSRIGLGEDTTGEPFWAA